MADNPSVYSGSFIQVFSPAEREGSVMSMKKLHGGFLSGCMGPEKDGVITAWP